MRSGSLISLPINVGTVNNIAIDLGALTVLHVHRAQQGVIPARGSSLIVDGEIDAQISHPARFLERNDVRMLTQAPAENACSRSG